MKRYEKKYNVQFNGYGNLFYIILKIKFNPNKAVDTKTQEFQRIKKKQKHYQDARQTEEEDEIND